MIERLRPADAVVTPDSAAIDGDGVSTSRKHAAHQYSGWVPVIFLILVGLGGILRLVAAHTLTPHVDEGSSLLAAHAVADRAARRLLAPVQDRHWLYPGAPTGTPLCPSALVRRLAAVDVTITPARTGALTALPQRLPPPVLAELTGMDPATATRWRSTVSASNAH